MDLLDWQAAETSFCSVTANCGVGMYDRIHDIILPNWVGALSNQECTRAIRGTQVL
jgi:hypothetical protein